jgi:hypothetical protein
VFESLTEPNRDPAREWLILRDDEQLPTILTATSPHTVTWSSVWVRRPDAVIQFDLDGGWSETMLQWALYVDEPAPDDALVGRMRRRLNELINANLETLLVLTVAVSIGIAQRVLRRFDAKSHA